jgi:hypothetical protein
VAGVECRCEEVTYLYGEEAWEYAEHLDTVASQPGQWLVRCPNPESSTSRTPRSIPALMNGWEPGDIAASP